MRKELACQTKSPAIADKVTIGAMIAKCRAVSVHLLGIGENL